MKRPISPESPSPPRALDADRRVQGSGKSVPRVSEMCKKFQYRELVKATNGFSLSNKIGGGSFGDVFKGIIDGGLVAVKKLKVGSQQGEREFLAEVNIISAIHHRHLVSLVGYCVSGIRRLLVYEYVPNGTMSEALHSPGRPCMTWATRLNIARGTARGLAYLHHGCRKNIIHRDIKSSNILLDEQWEAQVADFGLAKVKDHAQTHVDTRAMGTFGYVAPEYAASGKLSDKADVYSFGVVLLELITGKEAIYKSLPDAVDKENLVDWARPLLIQALETGNVVPLADPNLMGEYDENMFTMVKVAAACVRLSFDKRPNMADALHVLAPPDSDLYEGIIPGNSRQFVGGESSEDHRKKLNQIAFGNLTSQSGSDYTEDRRSDEVLQETSTETEKIVGDGQPGEDHAQLATTGEQGNTRDIHVINENPQEEIEHAEPSSPMLQARSSFLTANIQYEKNIQEVIRFSFLKEYRRVVGQMATGVGHAVVNQKDPSVSVIQLTPPVRENMDRQKTTRRENLDRRKTKSKELSDMLSDNFFWFTKTICKIDFSSIYGLENENGTSSPTLSSCILGTLCCPFFCISNIAWAFLGPCICWGDCCRRWLCVDDTIKQKRPACELFFCLIIDDMFFFCASIVFKIPFETHR